MVDLSLRDDRGKEDICPVCLNFSKPTTPKLGHVKKAAVNASCKACALLLKAIRHFHLTDGLVFVGSTSTQYDSVDGTQTAFHPEDEIIVHLDATPSIWYNLPAPRVQFALKGEGNPPFTDVVQLYTPPGEQAPWRAVGSSAEVPRFSSDNVCFQRIQEWVKECRSTHSSCRSRDKPPAMPQRVLDVNNSRLRLVEPSEREEYLTLSHCWGVPSTQPKTLRANIRSRMKNIAWNNLNQTYKDAVTITRRLGFRYIWIDSLCIVQDNSEEWEAAAGGMADIFANSFLTICASHAKDGSVGIFADRQPSNGAEPSTALPNVSLRTTVRSQTTVGVERDVTICARLLARHYFQGIADDHYVEHLSLWQRPRPVEEPLFFRAWALQERILSLRTLDYHCHEMVWECEGMRKCECEETENRGLRTQKARFNEPWLWKSYGSLPDSPDDNVWNRIVVTYSALSLTFESDRLPALAGLAQGIETDKNHNYYAGIWEEDLPYSLLWYHNCFDLEKLETQSLSAFHRRLEVPSWSWISVTGPVAFLQRRLFQEVYVTVATGSHDFFQSRDRFTRCKKMPLRIRGPVTSARFGHHGKQSTQFWIDGGEFLFTIYPDLNYCEPGTPYYLEPKSNVWLLGLTGDVSTISGLILRNTDVKIEGERACERLGIFIDLAAHQRRIFQRRSECIKTVIII